MRGIVEEAAEKVESATSAAKAANKVLIAALKRCATQKPDFFRRM
jgi:hypothetical protein